MENEQKIVVSIVFLLLMVVAVYNLIKLFLRIGFLKLSKPDSDFVTFPILYTPDNESELSKLGLQADPEMWRLSHYRKGEIVGFFPHDEPGKLWVELKNGSCVITSIHIKAFKQMIES